MTESSIHSEYINYSQGDTKLRGYLAYDTNGSGARPGVLIMHDWTGEGAYVERRARQLAGLGYVAFAADIYGVGIRPQKMPEVMEEATKYYTNRTLARQRAQAALEVMHSRVEVDRNRIAAIGYCFGGMVALELARSGAELRAVAVFHAILAPAPSGDAPLVKAKILAMQGGDDPVVTAEQTAAFVQEMQAGRVDWQLVQYGGAVHSFTLDSAGSDNSTGSAYNEAADRRSWQAMLNFFSEAL